MHHHCTKYFFFDSIIDEQRKQLNDINFRYGGDAIRMGKTVAGTNFLAISVYGGDMRTAFEKLASLEKEVRDIHLKSFVFANAENDGECDDEACINPEAGKDTKRTN